MRIHERFSTGKILHVNAHKYAHPIPDLNSDWIHKILNTVQIIFVYAHKYEHNIDDVNSARMSVNSARTDKILYVSMLKHAYHICDVTEREPPGKTNER